MRYPVRVLFVCYRNAIRSPIAEALLRRIGKQDFQVSSAGIAPEGLDPLAVEVMAGRMHIDISGHVGMSVDELFDREFDYIITLCDQAEAYLSDLPGPHRCFRWNFPDIAELGGDLAARQWMIYRLCLRMAARINRWVAQELRLLRRPSAPPGLILPRGISP